MKCCVYTRAFYETPYIDFFIEHYIKLGFDKIIILQTDIFEYTIPTELVDFVEIYKVENLADDTCDHYKNIILNSDYDWILSIDVDEILLLNKKYKDIKDYIITHLNENMYINIFFFRWGMIEKIDNNDIVSFTEILTKYNIYSNPHIKSMCHKNSISHIYCHTFSVNENNIIYFEGKITHENKPIWYDLNDNSYEDAILVHVHTRSIHNILIKSFMTKFSVKEICNKQGFLDFINGLDMNYDKDNIIEKFKEYVGLKVILAFSQTISAILDTNNYITYNIYNYKYNLINTEKEKLLIQCILTNNNIDIDKYYIFTTLLSNEINKKHYITFYK